VICLEIADCVQFVFVILLYNSKDCDDNVALYLLNTNDLTCFCDKGCGRPKLYSRPGMSGILLNDVMYPIFC